MNQDQIQGQGGGEDNKNSKNTSKHFCINRVPFRASWFSYSWAGQGLAEDSSPQTSTIGYSYHWLDWKKFDFKS